MSRVGPKFVRPVAPAPHLDCSGCQHLDRQLVRSGQYPVYHSLCTHPAIDRHPTLEPDGRQISTRGETMTPQWCPAPKPAPGPVPRKVIRRGEA